MVIDSQDSAPAAGEPIPYVGPRPFESEDRVIFFGRDYEAAELLAQIVSYRTVVLYAPSGAGKTSLLNAQIVPQLEAKGFEVLAPARVQGAALADLPQSANPYVVSALSGWTEADLSPADLAQLTIAGYLAQQEPLEDKYGQAAPRVLIFDQFEELFTAYPTRWPDRTSFFAQLCDALESDPWLRIVLSMREDFIAQLEPYAADMPDFLRHRFRLERMRPEAALQAVTGPLRDTRRQFAPGAAERLVEELGQTRFESATGTIKGLGQFIEPVQLQVVCRNLWLSLPDEIEEITEAEIDAYGDVSRALSEYYETVVYQTARGVRVSESTLRDWFEKKLITSAETRGLVFFDQDKGETAGLRNDAVLELDRQHIIRGELRAGSRWYELIHDRFIDPIISANEEWRRRRLERVVRFGLVVLGLLAIAFIGSFILVNNRTAQDESQEATRVALAGSATANSGTQVALSIDLTRAVETVVAATATQVSDQATASVVAATATRDMQTAVAATATRIGEYAQATASVIAATEVARATIDAQATVNAQELQRLPIRPLRPGISIGAGSTRITASLTGFALKDGQLMLLAPTSLLGEPNRFDPTVVIIQPGAMDGGQLTNAVGRACTDTQVSVQRICNIPVDPAFLSWLSNLDPGIAVQVTIPGLGAIRGVRAPQPGMTVRILSRSGDTISGQLPPDFAPVQQAGITTIPLPGITLQAGDEGGLVIDEDGFAIGLIASVPDPSGAGEDAPEMAPLGEVMDGLDATFLYQGLLLADLTGPNRELKAIGFSPDGRWLAGVSFDSNVYLWDIADGLPLAPPRILPNHPRGIWDLTFSDDSRFLATTGIAIDVESGSQLYLWDLTTRDPAASPVRLGGGFGDLVDVDVSPDGRWVASTGANDDIYLWDLSDGANRRVLLNGHAEDAVINELFFGPDSRWLASAGTDRTVRLWDLEAAAGTDFLSPAYTLDDFDNSVIYVTGSPDGRYLAASSSNVVTLWDLLAWPDEPALLDTFDGHTGRVTILAISPDGRLLASSDEEGVIWVNDLEARESLAVLTGHDSAVRALAFSPDGEWLASGDLGGIIRVWSMTTTTPGDRVLTLAGHDGPVSQLAFRPDGLWLASGGQDATVKLWQVK